MKKRKGFVFIETLIVIAVLTSSLLLIYTTYNSVLIKENTRMRYNDSVYMFRTYYLTRFFKNFRLDTVVSNLNLTDKSKPINVLSGFSCASVSKDDSNNNNIVNPDDKFQHNESIFGDDTASRGFCEEQFTSLNVSNIYLTYNDLSFLQNCTETSKECEVLSQVRSDAAEYLKTVGGKGPGYRIIIEYSENKDGTFCQEEDACDNGATNRSCMCKYHYTTLSLGEI